MMGINYILLVWCMAMSLSSQSWRKCKSCLADGRVAKKCFCFSFSMILELGFLWKQYTA